MVDPRRFVRRSDPLPSWFNAYRLAEETPTYKQAVVEILLMLGPMPTAADVHVKGVKEGYINNANTGLKRTVYTMRHHGELVSYPNGTGGDVFWFPRRRVIPRRTRRIIPRQ